MRPLRCGPQPLPPECRDDIEAHTPRAGRNPGNYVSGCGTCDDRSRVFKYLLRLPDGEPPDPAMLVTAVPTCRSAT